ncbi:uncharacterized protein LOC131232418 [Magnolia sinica]|uniref:uncharacterized protein LOC131232418 n=1 Tax=Magnolia sinica TaxID=86752 RepID=UPI00265B061A|nr:uncharacterized protein LOC131232418 [Magnolia sinica]
MSAQIPLRFSMPQITSYTGTTGPTEHLESYRAWMELQGTSTTTMCHAFSLTLAGAPRKWIRQLKQHSIDSFVQLRKAFITNFIGGKENLKPSSHLLNVVQKEGELLKDYIKHFNLETMQVLKHSEDIALTALMGGLRERRFLFSLDKNSPTTMADLLNKAQK